MNDEELELVTAYLDGEATPAERARVEADAELLAEVERQRAVRAQLHDVEPPSDPARESAIAAALAVFDDEIAPVTTPAAASPAVPDVTAPTNIVPFARRRRLRWMQSLGAAAAVAAVVVAGAVIATRGDDDDSTANEVREVATAAADTEAIEQEVAPPQLPGAPAEAIITTTSDEGLLMATETTGGPAVAADEAAEPDVQDGAAETEAAAGAGPPTTMASAAAPAPTTTRSFVVQTSDDLLDLAEMIKAAPLDRDEAETDCEDGSLKADATFEDDDGIQHEIVVVAIDDDTIGALTLDECTIALEAALDLSP